MNLSDSLKSFLLDLKNNRYVLKQIGLPSNQIDTFVEYLSQYLQNDRYWEICKLIDKDYGYFKVENGEIKLNSDGMFILSNKNSFLQNPQKSFFDKDEKILYVIDGNDKIYRFDENFSYIGEFAKSGIVNPTLEDMYYSNATNIYVSKTKVYVVSENTHRIFIFDKKTHIREAIIGDGISGDFHTDQRLYNPTSIVELPNGHLLISNRYSNIGNNQGNILHLDNNYQFVDYLLTNRVSGLPWQNEVENPIQLKLFTMGDEIHLYIVYENYEYVSLHRINIDDVNNVTQEYLKVFSKPYELKSNVFSISDIEVEYYQSGIDENENPIYDGYVYISLKTPDIILCLDFKTNDLIGTFGETVFEDYPEAKPNFGNYYNLNSVSLMDNQIVIVDNINKKVESFDKYIVFDKEIELKYENKLDLFNCIDYKSIDIDDSSKLNVKIKDVIMNKIENKIIILGRK